MLSDFIFNAVNRVNTTRSKSLAASLVRVREASGHPFPEPGIIGRRFLDGTAKSDNAGRHSRGAVVGAVET